MGVGFEEDVDCGGGEGEGGGVQGGEEGGVG